VSDRKSCYDPYTCPMLNDTSSIFPHGRCCHDGHDHIVEVTPTEPCRFVEVEKVKDDLQPMLFGRSQDCD